MDKTSKLLRIYNDESAYLGDQRLFEFIAALAREQQMAGMTILEANARLRPLGPCPPAPCA